MKCGKIHALEIFKTRRLDQKFPFLPHTPAKPHLASPEGRNNTEEREP